VIHVTRRRLADFSCAIALSCVVASAHGQDYPARPVRFIVPFASGTFDLVARTVAQKLSEIWGQQVVVDNRPGGATIIATELTAKSSPDGYTMYLSPNALAANPALHKKLPYAQKDLAPVLLVAAQPMALGAHPSFVANTIRDLIRLAKPKPGAFAYGTAGIGSGGYLAGEIFKSTAGIDLIHVSYKSGGLAMTDVLGNQIPLVMTGLPNLLPHHKTKRLKILAITDGSRSPVAQDIPTIGETVPGYEFKNWFGVLVASGTPRAIVQKINADINKVLGTPDTRQKLIDQGFIVIGGTSEEFAKVIKDDTARFADIIGRAGIKPN
jgi:tripartite-type tricarboxylate transporter receptor subunit TctC